MLLDVKLASGGHPFQWFLYVKLLETRDPYTIKHSSSNFKENILFLDKMSGKKSSPVDNVQNNSLMAGSRIGRWRL